GREATHLRRLRGTILINQLSTTKIETCVAPPGLIFIFSFSQGSATLHPGLTFFRAYGAGTSRSHSRLLFLKCEPYWNLHSEQYTKIYSLSNQIDTRFPFPTPISGSMGSEKSLIKPNLGKEISFVAYLRLRQLVQHLWYLVRTSLFIDTLSAGLLT